MKSQICNFTFLSLTQFLLSCTSVSITNPEANGMGAICNEKQKCYFEGVVSIWESHPPMAKMITDDGSCINVSFPINMMNKIRKTPQQRLKVLAYKMKTPPEQTDTGDIIYSVKVKGREIPPAQCSDFYLFVD